MALQSLWASSGQQRARVLASLARAFESETLRDEWFLAAVSLLDRISAAAPPGSSRSVREVQLDAAASILTTLKQACPPVLHHCAPHYMPDAVSRRRLFSPFFSGVDGGRDGVRCEGGGCLWLILRGRVFFVSMCVISVCRVEASYSRPGVTCVFSPLSVLRQVVHPRPLVA